MRMTLMRPWRLFGSRGNLFAKALVTEWGITGSMKQLPEHPWWLINATTYETGRNWRFSRRHIGDWKFGHNYTQDVPICLAVAASAAIPYMAGLIKIDATPDGWFEIDSATEKPIQEKPPLRKAVRLWDGGVYENLGVEGVWKPSGFVDPTVGFMVVSDGSAYLGEELGWATGIFTAHPPFLRPPRLFDIVTEQTRALRSRMLMNAVTGDGKFPASIVRLGRSVDFIGKQAKRTRGTVAPGTFLDSAAVQRAERYPTNASRMRDCDFELLLRHGFESADATLTGYAAAVFTRSFIWDDIHPRAIAGGRGST
jgi:NTE family protein